MLHHKNLKKMRPFKKTKLKIKKMKIYKIKMIQFNNKKIIKVVIYNIT